MMAQLGYRFSNRQFQYLAGELLHSLGRKKDNKPLSNNWLYAFLKHWQHRITSLKPQKLDASRAKSTTPETVDSYFQNIGEIIDKHPYLEKPHLVYNVGETAFREERPLDKIIAIKSGGEAVDEFLRQKIVLSQSGENAQCNCNKRTYTAAKPKPGGRAITNDDYIQDLEEF
ncbi:hypothetical protein ACF0H5_003282 [Mactra antiquata]